MGTELLPLVTLLPCIFSMIVGSKYDIDPIITIPIGLLVGVSVAIVWAYSPLPNRVGLVVNTEAGYWGFKKSKEGNDAE